MKKLKTKDGFAYEPRPQQKQMALAIAEAIDSGTNLCIEAPTGVGKTFAYLVPAVLKAKESGRPVIISTHTINLQEQILSHDVPMLEQMLGYEVSAVVAKGKSNYLCWRRFAELGDMQQELLELDHIDSEMVRLRKWAFSTMTGDRNDIPRGISPQLWRAVCCERGNCLGTKCDYYKKCFLQRAKRAVNAADIIISNHAKFFTSLAADTAQKEKPHKHRNNEEQESILPDYAALIMDEGHTLEETASSHLGARVESYTLRYHLNRLFNNDIKSGVLDDPAYISAQNAVVNCRKMCDLFFQHLLEWLIPQEKNPLRYTVPNHIANYLGNPMERVLQEIRSILEHTEDETIASELEGIQMELEEAATNLENFFSMGIPDCVYWFEREGKDLKEVSLNIVPISIAPSLENLLFSKPPVIVTSATLAVNNNIRYFQQRVGCLQAQSLVLDSPFDYEHQVKLYIARNMPDPRERQRFLEEATNRIRYFLQMTQGRAFVLFTSYQMMRETATLMEPFFLQEEMTLLMQGEGLTPRKMLQEFKTSSKAVIFGTSSFWTGVDVPGDSLSNVIITRLPFAVPDHPLSEARTQQVEMQGMNSFMDYSVPEAVLKFRQGFGRLIRTRTDKGIVVVLDSRIVTKRYGQAFLNSIPKCETITID